MDLICVKRDGNALKIQNYNSCACVLIFVKLWLKNGLGLFRHLTSRQVIFRHKHFITGTFWQGTFRHEEFLVAGHFGTGIFWHSGHFGKGTLWHWDFSAEHWQNVYLPKCPYCCAWCQRIPVPKCPLCRNDHLPKCPHAKMSQCTVP